MRKDNRIACDRPGRVQSRGCDNTRGFFVGFDSRLLVSRMLGWLLFDGNELLAAGQEVATLRPSSIVYAAPSSLRQKKPMSTLTIERKSESIAENCELPAYHTLTSSM